MYDVYTYKVLSGNRPTNCVRKLDINNIHIVNMRLHGLRNLYFSHFAGDFPDKMNPERGIFPIKGLELFILPYLFRKKIQNRMNK